jgi:thiol:disulfide interchange protein DsbC
MTMKNLLPATLALALIATIASTGQAQPAAARAPAAAASASAAVLPQDAAIRDALTKRLPNLAPIDEISKTAIPGLFEVRMGAELIYTDERGDYVLDGALIDTKTRTNLTEERVTRLTAFDFAALPLKDAIVWKQGKGTRKLVVFADPNCGYCKKFETELQQIKDVTVYTYLVPILGGDSPSKSRDIWCARDNSAVWRDWMIKGTTPQRSMGQCDISALQRNVALARKHRVNSTPSIVFEDGKRVAGAMAPEDVEKQLTVSRRKG